MNEVQYSIEDNVLYQRQNDNVTFKLPLVDVGSTVYMPIYRRKIVVKCSVVELTNIYIVEGYKHSVWRYIDKDQDYTYADAAEDSPPVAWNDFVKTLAAPPVLANQFIWVDEPVGHAVSVSDEVFLNLSDALCGLPHSRKKHLKRRLKKYRNVAQKFIASTWKVNGDNHPGFSPLPEKKIYVMKQHNRGK